MKKPTALRVWWFPSAPLVKCQEHNFNYITNTCESTPSQRFWSKTRASRADTATINTNGWTAYTIDVSTLLEAVCSDHVITTWTTSRSVPQIGKHTHTTRPTSKLNDTTNGVLRAIHHWYWWTVIYSRHTCVAATWTGLPDLTHFIMVRSLYRQEQLQR